MSVTLYVLDTAEFIEIGVAAAEAGMTGSPAGDYVRWTSDRADVVIRRDPHRLRDALWFAALTGGCDARIAHFDDSSLTLVGVS